MKLFKQKLFKQSQKAIAAILTISSLAGSLTGCGNRGPEGKSAEEPSKESSLPAAADLPSTVPSAENDTPTPRPASPDIESPEDFYAYMIPALLGNANGENRVCSPVNIYMALSMLTEITAGESQAQLMSLLGEKETSPLRSYVTELWDGNCRDDQIYTLLPAASLWADKDLSLKKDTVKTLSDSYHASVHQGQMGSDKLNQEFQEWLSDQTGGFLDRQISNQAFPDETVLSLAATLYFKGRWLDEFSKKATTEDIFHAESEDITCEFMNRHAVMNYYRGDSFAAIALPFSGGCQMWLLLPDETSSVEELLQPESGLTALVMHPSEWKDTSYITVNLSIPKFDVTYDMDLADNLIKSGVTDVFDPGAADFSAILNVETPVWLSQVTHAARVKIDEEGCEAAAFTSQALCGAVRAPEEQADFIADRPFIFVITGDGNAPLFAGLVNRP